MVEIMTVCTGNICRSPLAEQLLRSRLGEQNIKITSAGVLDLGGKAMPEEAQKLAERYGIDSEESAAHRSKQLTPELLETPNLVLAMSRSHRSKIVQMSPKRLRSTFTIREFARLSKTLSNEEIIEVARNAGDDHNVRMQAVLNAIAGQRGVAEVPYSADEDDVLDPYRRSWDDYLLSGKQLAPALDEVVRVSYLTVTA